MLLTSACDPANLDAAGLFTLVGSTAERSYLVPDRLTIGGNARLMRPTSGDVRAVRYRLGGQRRPYLLSGDLAAGITGGNTLHLPMLAAGDLERTVDITPFDSAQWTGFRVYDAGLCSLLVGWTPDVGFGELIGAPPIPELFIGAIDSSISSSLSIRGGVRTSPGLVTPVLRAATGPGGTLSTPTDAIRLRASYFASWIGQASGAEIGCSNVAFTLSVEVGFRRVNGAISNAPGCQMPGEPSDFILTNDDFTYDFVGVVYDASASIDSPGCALEEVFKGSLADGLRSGLPAAVRYAVVNATLVDRRTLGFGEADIRACTCDEECNEFSGAAYGFEGGRRPRCHFAERPAPGEGECWIQLEPDRINIRPDGVEVVLMEDDTDRQFSLIPSGLPFQLLCDPGRGGQEVRSGTVLAVDDPLLQTLATPFIVPVPAP